MSDFLKIAFTLPVFVDSEASHIMRLLMSENFDLVHIRKPDASKDDLRELIDTVDSSLHPRLKIHSHFSLLEEFDLGGVHINSRWPDAPDGAVISKSCHSLEELRHADCYAYVTLSPIFDSISKAGYHSRFDIRTIAPFVRGKRVVALGGVTPDRLHELQSCGFYGAAMLGAAWK